MATIYKNVKGMPIQRFIALNDGVQAALESTAQERAAEATALLDGRSQHRSFDSEITVTKGKIDRYVSLDDTRGLLAAWVIEFGRRGQGGVHALTDAFGLR